MSETPPASGPARSLGDLILELVVSIPASEERAQSANPGLRSRALARRAARKASLMAGSLALPPGPLAWLTIVPEMVAVWKLQSQMVSDIAAVYDKQATLSREQMVYCLFKHVAAQLFRDVVVRVGERYVVRVATLGLLQSIAKAVGVKISKSMIGKSAGRLLPLVGALGVGAYAYFDTTQVAKTAIDLFSKEVEIRSGDSPPP